MFDRVVRGEESASFIMPLFLPYRTKAICAAFANSCSRKRELENVDFVRNRLSIYIPLVSTPAIIAVMRNVLYLWAPLFRFYLLSLPHYYVARARRGFHPLISVWRISHGYLNEFLAS